VKNELTAKLEQYIQDCICYYDLPGLVIGVGLCGRDYTYQGASGFRNFDTKEPLKPDAIFHMASITKLFTSTAVMMLLQENKLRLEDKMIDILPTPSIDDKRYEEVTIKHILTHTSGILDAKFVYDPKDKHFLYSDLEYDTLATVIEAASGIRFDDFVNKKILLPLGMNDSEISITLRPDMVIGHSKNEENQITVGPYFEYQIERASSSTLTSHVGDMEKWGKEVLVKKTLLHPETYELALREYVPIPEMGQQMGMSWFKREQAGYTLYGHIGSDPGYRTAFWMCPELNLHYTVLANMTRTPIKKICEEIFDILRPYA